jgi:hypothetical protein
MQLFFSCVLLLAVLSAEGFRIGDVRRASTRRTNSVEHADSVIEQRIDTSLFSSYGGGGGGGYRGGGGRGGGGGGYKGRSGGGSRFPSQDTMAKLRFKETIKIDPDFKTPVVEMGFSEPTLKCLKAKVSIQLAK